MTIITARTGPTLPLLTRVNAADDWPYYTGPLGVARLLVLAHGEHIVETTKYEVKHGAFIASDPAGENVNEWAIDYTSPDDVLRRALGVYFTRLGYDAVSLGVALRHVLSNQLEQLEGATT